MGLSKGQYTIGEIFMFSISIILALVVFMLMASSDNIVDKEVEQQVNYALGEVTKRSVVTVTMRDYLWRAPTRIQPGGGPSYTGIDRDDYGYIPAYKGISYYFTDDSNFIFLDGEAKAREDVREDLKSYLKYKMEQHWGTGAGQVDYYLNISSSASDSPDSIVVKSEDYEPSGRWSKLSYPVALADGREATVTLWTKTSQNVYAVNPDGLGGVSP